MLFHVVMFALYKITEIGAVNTARAINRVCMQSSPDFTI